MYDTDVYFVDDTCSSADGVLTGAHMQVQRRGGREQSAMSMWRPKLPWHTELALW